MEILSIINLLPKGMLINNYFFITVNLYQICFLSKHYSGIFLNRNDNLCKINNNLSPYIYFGHDHPKYANQNINCGNNTIKCRYVMMNDLIIFNNNRIVTNLISNITNKIVDIKRFYEEYYIYNILLPIPVDYKIKDGIVIGFENEIDYRSQMMSIHTQVCFEHIQNDRLIECRKKYLMYTYNNNVYTILTHEDLLSIAKINNRSVLYGVSANQRLALPLLEFESNESIDLDDYFHIEIIDELIVFQMGKNIFIDIPSISNMLKSYDIRKKESYFQCKDRLICYVPHNNINRVAITLINRSKTIYYRIPITKFKFSNETVISKVLEYNNNKYNMCSTEPTTIIPNISNNFNAETIKELTLGLFISIILVLIFIIIAYAIMCFKYRSQRKLTNKVKS